VIGPAFPRLAALLSWARSPGLFATKVRRRLTRLRREPAYRAALKAGHLVVEPDSRGEDTFFTVATPVWRVAEGHLRAAIDSVRRQSHRGWELWLADDASPDPHVRRVLAEAAREDPRIHVLHLPVNRGIAGATDAILREARGTYVAFLDHDDLLHPRALELASAHLARHRDVDWLFTDEDKIDRHGRHREPCLKPGWSRHLLLSFNYVTHLRVVRRATIESVGGHREGLDGAQDYDLALRVLAAGGRFAHLRGVLYHWRTVPGSMARAALDKPSAHTHALAALSGHAASWPSGGPPDARVLVGSPSFFRLRRAADPLLAVALLADASAGTAPGGRVREVLAVGPDPGPGELAEAVRRIAAPVVVRWPGGAPPAEDLEELLALLQVPGTAVVAPRLVSGLRVAASGWWLRDDGRLEDPWRGLRRDDPGYLNLAMVPGPRLLPPGTAWVAWRDAFLAAWEQGEGTVPGWRLAAGLARLGREAIVTPTSSLEGTAAPPPEGEPPEELTRHGSRWLDRFGLLWPPPQPPTPSGGLRWGRGGRP
jgi:hypothetical protein